MMYVAIVCGQNMALKPWIDSVAAIPQVRFSFSIHCALLSHQC